MISKSEVGTTLDKINWDIQFAKEMLMENAPKQTGYDTKMQRVARLARMEVQTTKPYSPWQKKSETVIKIIDGKDKRRIVQRNIPNRVWDVRMICELEIYSSTAGKY